MDPHDWNSYLAGEAAEADMASQLVAETEKVLAGTVASGEYETYWRWLAMRILTWGDDARPPR